MQHLANDRWQGQFTISEVGTYYYTVMCFVDKFRTLQRSVKEKYQAGKEPKVDAQVALEIINDALSRAVGKERTRLREIGISLKEVLQSNIAKAVSMILSDELTLLIDRYQDESFSTFYGKQLAVLVDRQKALFSTWYELFPRSCSNALGKHGTLKDCKRLLPELAALGFDVLYLPPIHPIGKTNRRGRNNLPTNEADSPGSPWAIGSEGGGHKSINPQLGSFKDFDSLVNEAQKYGIEIALDLAFQGSPDHPYIKDHPQWFEWLPDGGIHYAENPPKKYEDIVPFFFDSDDWQNLWEELKSIVFFWIDKGVRIFRVDNPHTKPFRFWKWLIDDVRVKHSEVIFLSEAFTRPKVMYHLAKAGFTQSYTYFTWRNTKHELIEYLTELTQTDVKEYFRPNFWPNTPDILSEYLQHGGRPAFMVRLVLAATLSSNYGIYGPAYEFCINEAIPGKEEYLNSEKYEIKHWDRENKASIKDFIRKVNRIRKDNLALQDMRIRFCEISNDNLIVYVRSTEDLSNVMLIVVNLDPLHVQSGWVKVPIWELGIEQEQPYLVDDLLNEEKYIWHGEWNYVELNPKTKPAHIFRVRRRLRRENDFDYYI